MHIIVLYIWKTHFLHKILSHGMHVLKKTPEVKSSEILAKVFIQPEITYLGCRKTGGRKPVRFLRKHVTCRVIDVRTCLSL
jgi:hypothetical protein